MLPTDDVYDVIAAKVKGLLFVELVLKIMVMTLMILKASAILCQEYLTKAQLR